LKALLYLVLMLGSLLGGTAQVLAAEVRLAEVLPDRQSDAGRCLGEHGQLPDLPPLPSDNEPRLPAAEAAFNPSCRQIPLEALTSDVPAGADASAYPIRAPPLPTV